MEENNPITPLVEEEKDEIPAEDSGSSGLPFKTVSAEGEDKSLEERLSEMESFLESINEKLSDSDDTRAIYDDMVNFYNSFEARTKELSDKLDNDFEYKRYLESEIKRRQENLEKLGLMKSLKEDRAQMGLKVDEITRIMDERLKEIDIREKDELDNLDGKIFQFAGLLEKFVLMDKSIDEKLERYRKEMTRASENEFTILATKCMESVSKNNEKMEAIKKDVVTFLKTCEKQNGQLIAKVPAVKGMISMKDIFIIILSGISVVSLVTQFVLMFTS